MQNSHEDSGHQVTPTDFSEYGRELLLEVASAYELRRRAGDVNPLIAFWAIPERRKRTFHHVHHSPVCKLPHEARKVTDTHFDDRILRHRQERSPRRDWFRSRIHANINMGITRSKVGEWGMVNKE